MSACCPTIDNEGDEKHVLKLFNRTSFRGVQHQLPWPYSQPEVFTILPFFFNQNYYQLCFNLPLGK